MKSEKRIFLSFLLNLIFTIIEFVGGIITNFVVLISDSVHDLRDSISIGIAFFLERKSKKNQIMYIDMGIEDSFCLHALLDEDLTSYKILKVQNRLKKILIEFGIKHRTIQVKFTNIDCNSEIS